MRPYDVYMEKLAIGSRLAERISSAMAKEVDIAKRTGNYHPLVSTGWRQRFHGIHIDDTSTYPSSMTEFNHLYPIDSGSLVQKLKIFGPNSQSSDGIKRNRSLNHALYFINPGDWKHSAINRGRFTGGYSKALDHMRLANRNSALGSRETIDRLMMSGRHAGNRHVYQLPESFDYATKVTSGPGIHQDIAYRGEEGIQGGESDYPPNTRRWTTGLPMVARGYTIGAPLGSTRISVHDLSGAKSAGPWTPHIAKDTGSIAAAKEIVATSHGRTAGRDSWGDSPVYERVVDHADLRSSEISRLKKLPSGNNWQQVSGKLTPHTHPWNIDSGRRLGALDIEAANHGAAP